MQRPIPVLWLGEANTATNLHLAPDTIDLQDQDAPSAKSHPKHPTLDSDAGEIAPHQASTLRGVAHRAAEEQARSPHLSWAEGDTPDGAGDFDLQKYAEDLSAGMSGSTTMTAGSHSMAATMQQQQTTQQKQEQDALAIAQNGGGNSSSDDEEMDGDEDDDDDMDDDMMDKISSSPSIEDGGCYLGVRGRPTEWPRRIDSLPLFHGSLEGEAEESRGPNLVGEEEGPKDWASSAGPRSESEYGSGLSCADALEEVSRHSTGSLQDGHHLHQDEAANGDSTICLNGANGEQPSALDEGDSWAATDESRLYKEMENDNARG